MKRNQGRRNRNPFGVGGRLRLVRFGDRLTAHDIARYPFRKGMTLLYLGEIHNMPGHCAVVDPKTGKVHIGYHCDLFNEMTDSET